MTEQLFCTGVQHCKSLLQFKKKKKEKKRRKKEKHPKRKRKERSEENVEKVSIASENTYMVVNIILI